MWLDGLAGYSVTYANDVNIDGTIVGRVKGEIDGDCVTRAVCWRLDNLWEPDDLTDLMALDPNEGYRVTQLYGKNPVDDPQATVQGLDCTGVLLEPDVQQVREIEVDTRGNLYVLSAQQINDNDWLLVYDTTLGNTSEQRIDLSGVIEGPSALLVSAAADALSS